MSCEFSRNVTPRDGNCLFHAILDGILNNEAFRHTNTEDETGPWVELLKRLEIYEEGNIIQRLRQRWVVEASSWLAGKNNSKLNDKLLLGYSDNEWNYVWATMLEDGAWAVPHIKDGNGNILKENHAPELLLKYIAHDLQCNILILDLYNNTVEFCSGNQVLDNNVKFDSPLLLYATGSHFQSVFPVDHEYFIQHSSELQNRYFPKSPMSEEHVEENQSNTKSDRNSTTKTNDQADISFSADIKRLEELTKIKVKERNTVEKKEINKLRKRIFRHENEKYREKQAESNRKINEKKREDNEF